MRWTMPSVTYLRLIVMSALSAVLLVYQFRSASLPCRSARMHSNVLVYSISDIGRCRKCG